MPRLQDEIAARTGERISKSRLSVVMRKKGLPLAAATGELTIEDELLRENIARLETGRPLD